MASENFQNVRQQIIRDRCKFRLQTKHGARSLLRLAAIQCFECKQDPADLSRKGRFIAAQAIKREAGQISQP